MSAVEDRLAELGLLVPEVALPVAAYLPAVRDGNYIFTSGQLPMVSGALAATGKVGVGPGQVSAEDAERLAQICALNAIAAVKALIGDLDKVTRVVKVVGFVASDPSFTGQPGVINGASTPGVFTPGMTSFWPGLIAGVVSALALISSEIEMR